MDKLLQFENYQWCKPDWGYPSMSKETNELLQQCLDLPKAELSEDVEDIIKNSKEFPIPFPIESVRLETLKERRPVERLLKNIVSTYPIIHERVLLLMAGFLNYKRKFGTSIEKALYKDMTVPQLIDRLLRNRAVAFLSKHDHYKLLTGEEHRGGRGARGPPAKQRKPNEGNKTYEGWEAVGTLQEKPPLLLENCLSYDEIKISAFVYVSGYTECINDGTRRNVGKVNEKDIESNAVIIGIIGPRFKRKFRMDYEDMILNKQQNVQENGYGAEDAPTSCLDMLKTKVFGESQERRMWRQLWADFYEVQSFTHEELTSNVKIEDKPVDDSYTDRYVKVKILEDIFDNEIYYKRLCVTVECVLIEAEERARVDGRDGFVNVIGAGLGVWRASEHQNDVYILTFLERIRVFLMKELLNHVTDINFAYIKPSDSILESFTNATGPDGKPLKVKKMFLENEKHPKGGINVQLEKREPSAKLPAQHSGKLLILTYAWDGNAQPGNEFWLGNLKGSGDSAAACATQVSELHNAFINPAVSANNVRIAGKGGVKSISEHCTAVIT